jgi:hypothetical protein
MPAIKYQKILTVAEDGVEGFEFQTTNAGKLRVEIEDLGSNTFRLTRYKDDVQQGSPITFQPINADQVGDSCMTFLDAETLAFKDPDTGRGHNIAVKVLSLSPLDVRILSSWDTISGDWWSV